MYGELESKKFYWLYFLLVRLGSLGMVSRVIVGCLVYGKFLMWEILFER